MRIEARPSPSLANIPRRTLHMRICMPGWNYTTSPWGEVLATLSTCPSLPTTAASRTGSRKTSSGPLGHVQATATPHCPSVAKPGTWRKLGTGTEPHLRAPTQAGHPRAARQPARLSHRLQNGKPTSERGEKHPRTAPEYPTNPPTTTHHAAWNSLPPVRPLHTLKSLPGCLTPRSPSALLP